jgi:SAM-dependent methyltransferase
VRLPGRDLTEFVGNALPTDHAAPVLADDNIEREVGRPADRRWPVFDLGCDVGSSIDCLRTRDPDVDRVGIDLPGSPEARTRPRTDARFETFDGPATPFPDGSFDLIYCKQVLEHLRRPPELLAEVRRVLAPDGRFAESTSQLEPYHSLSLWNYTPLGLAELLNDAGDCDGAATGVDSLTLIARRISGRSSWFGRWWARSSPLNRALDRYREVARLEPRLLNATKLLFWGQFAFLARPDREAT